MRNYKRNTPQAAARIVALVPVADGHACRSELEVACSEIAATDLGLEASAFRAVLQALCEDLQIGAGAGALLSGIDGDGLRSMMAEVDDPALQRRIVALAAAVAHADAHLADGETWVLDAAKRHWGLPAAGISPLPDGA